MCILKLFEVFSHIAAIIGIGFAAYQLLQTRRQAETSFEDSMAKEYRELASKLPTKVFYDKPYSEELTEDEKAKAQDEFYRYFDLTNGQIFLRYAGRISDQTWMFWCDGIKSNMERPAFKNAWHDIERKAWMDFVELRLLIANEYKIDPSCPEWMQSLEIMRQALEVRACDARRKSLQPAESNSTPPSA